MTHHFFPPPQHPDMLPYFRQLADVTQLAQGTHWKHHTGGVYRIVGLALDESDGKTVLVVYRSVDDWRLWVRTLESWQKPLHSGAARYVRAEPRVEGGAG